MTSLVLILLVGVILFLLFTRNNQVSSFTRTGLGAGSPGLEYNEATVNGTTANLTSNQGVVVKFVRVGKLVVAEWQQFGGQTTNTDDVKIILNNVPQEFLPIPTASGISSAFLGGSTVTLDVNVSSRGASTVFEMMYPNWAQVPSGTRLSVQSGSMSYVLF